MIVIDHGEVVFVGDVAHIIGASRAGPRGAAVIPNREAFSNLLLVCGRHHKVIDDRRTRDKYPPDMLRQWKRDREYEFDATTLAALDQLGSLTGKLPGLLVQSFKETTAELKATVDRFEEAGLIAHNAAEMLRDAVEQMPALGSDLHRTAQLLMSFADQMPHFGQSAMHLSSFADSGAGRSLYDVAEALNKFSTTVDVYELQRTVDQLNVVADRFPNPHDFREASAELSEARRAVVVPRPRVAGLGPQDAVADVEPDTDLFRVVKAVLISVVVGLVIGAAGVGWLMHNSAVKATQTRQACTGASAPPGFVVQRSVKVQGKLSPSPYVCPTWYPKPIVRPGKH